MTEFKLDAGVKRHKGKVDAYATNQVNLGDFGVSNSYQGSYGAGGYRETQQYSSHFGSAVGSSAYTSNQMSWSGVSSSHSETAHLGAFSNSSSQSQSMGWGSASSSSSYATKWGNRTLFGENQSSSISGHGISEHVQFNVGGEKINMGYNINFGSIGKGFVGAGKGIVQAANTVGKAGHYVAKNVPLNRDTLRAAVEVAKFGVEVGKAVGGVAVEVFKVLGK